MIRWYHAEQIGCGKVVMILNDDLAMLSEVSRKVGEDNLLDCDSGSGS